MTSAAERYQKDLDRLIKQGGKLVLSLQRQAAPDANVKTDLSEDELKNLPNFQLDYQAWYSESLAVISQLIPERVSDFQAYYAPKGPRKEIQFSNYTICGGATAVVTPAMEPQHGLGPRCNSQ